MPHPVTTVRSPARTGLLIGRSHTTRPPVAVDAAPIAVDLGSSLLRIWLGPGRTLSVPLGHGLRSPVVRRGRIVDGPACVTELRRMRRGSGTADESVWFSIDVAPLTTVTLPRRSCAAVRQISARERSSSCSMVSAFSSSLT